MLNLKEKTLMHMFRVKYLKGKDNPVADTLQVPTTAW